MNVKFGCRHVLRFGGVDKPEWTCSKLISTSELPTCMWSAAGLATNYQCSWCSKRLGVGSSRRLERNPSCIVLNSLQFLDIAGQCAVKYIVAVIDHGQIRLLTSVASSVVIIFFTFFLILIYFASGCSETVIIHTYKHKETWNHKMWTASSQLSWKTLKILLTLRNGNRNQSLVS